MRLLLFDTTLYFPGPLFLDAVKELSGVHELAYHFFDEAPYLSSLHNSLTHKILYRVLGRRPVSFWKLNRTLINVSRKFHPDVVLITKGTYLAPSTLQAVKNETGAILVNYATDDPFNGSPHMCFVRESVGLYDYYASPRRAAMDDIRRARCKNVAFVPFAYKPAAHFPEHPHSEHEREKFKADVVFIGGCDEDRVPFFDALIKSLPNLRLALYGGYWNRVPILRRYHRGFAHGRDFRLALGGAKIAINLVRRSNRDGHVMRSFEVPACGAFMIAERTDEHLELFGEDSGVVFFSSPDELVEKVDYFLKHDDDRMAMAERAHKKVIAGANTYTDRLRAILDWITSTTA